MGLFGGGGSILAVPIFVYLFQIKSYNSNELFHVCGWVFGGHWDPYQYKKSN